MYACIIDIYVPYEVKYQRAIAKRTSEIYTESVMM